MAHLHQSRPDKDLLESARYVRGSALSAGAIRFRPMLLTAASVVVGTAVMLTDPIFQGLALSLMAGEVAATFLSRLAVPVLYYLSERRYGPAATQSETQPVAEAWNLATPFPVPEPRSS